MSLLAEDLLLLLTDDRSGKLLAPAMQVDVALGGALLIELALAERIDVADGRLVVLDAHPTLDGLLDETLAEVSRRQGKKPKDVVRGLGKGLGSRLYERLAEQGVLREEHGKILDLLPVHHWPTSDGEHETEVRELVIQAARTGAVADARTGALVALLHALKAVAKVIDPASAGVKRAAECVPGLVGALGVAYLTFHLALTGTVLLWLHRRRPAAYPFVRTTLMIASALGLAGYIVFATAPPRLAGIGILDTVTGHAHVNLNKGLVSAFYNPFAAMPSMHAGYALVVGATLLRHGRRQITRLAGLVYPAFIVFVIVATGKPLPARRRRRRPGRRPRRRRDRAPAPATDGGTRRALQPSARAGTGSARRLNDEHACEWSAADRQHGRCRDSRNYPRNLSQSKGLSERPAATRRGC